ncbi:MAG: hypothetical protein ACE5K4_12455 [Candidatus Hydrothermarchaeota archaeon]
MKVLNIPQRRKDVEKRLKQCSKLDLKVLRAIGLGYTKKSSISKFIGRNGRDVNLSLKKLTSKGIGFVKFVSVKTCYGPVSYYSLRDYGMVAYKIEFEEYPIKEQSLSISNELQVDHKHLQEDVLSFYEWKGF